MSEEASLPAGKGPVGSARARIRGVSAYVIAAFWGLLFIENTVVSYMEHGTSPAALLARLAVLAVGVAISCALVEITILLLRHPFHKRVIGAVSSSTVGWIVVSFVNYRVFQLVTPAGEAAELVFVAVFWSWFLYSFAGAILAVAYYVDVRERDARLAELKLVARDAQLRALRYQLNPHFLFNALNSVASLISGGSAEHAERMVVSLSDFMRSSLALDPSQEITLAQEVDLQRLYLDIETTRFPARLGVEIDLPPLLRNALVPSLITQPLIENAVKHSVPRSRARVVIRVAAREAAGSLELRITNTGGDLEAAPAPGTGTGLRNVADRLRAHFDGRGTVKAGPLAGGGFETTLSMPLRFHAP